MDPVTCRPQGGHQAAGPLERQLLGAAAGQWRAPASNAPSAPAGRRSSRATRPPRQQRRPRDPPSVGPLARPGTRVGPGSGGRTGSRGWSPVSQSGPRGRRSLGLHPGTRSGDLPGLGPSSRAGRSPDGPAPTRASTGLTRRPPLPPPPPPPPPPRAGNWSTGDRTPPPRAQPCARSMRTRRHPGPGRAVTPAINRSRQPRPSAPRARPASSGWPRPHAHQPTPPRPEFLGRTCWAVFPRGFTGARDPARAEVGASSEGGSRAPGSVSLPG